MPYSKEANGDGTYRVVNEATGDVKAKSTSSEDADKQIRLLNAVDHGFKPRRRFGGRHG